jgi:hypothetical protein
MQHGEQDQERQFSRRRHLQGTEVAFVAPVLEQSDDTSLEILLEEPGSCSILIEDPFREHRTR